MKTALIGYTGFVGSNCNLSNYDALINTKNIEKFIKNLN